MIKQINFHNLVVYDTYVIILSELWLPIVLSFLLHAQTFLKLENFTGFMWSWKTNFLHILQTLIAPAGKGESFKNQLHIKSNLQVEFKLLGCWGITKNAV